MVLAAPSFVVQPGEPAAAAPRPAGKSGFSQETVTFYRRSHSGGFYADTNCIKGCDETRRGLKLSRDSHVGSDRPSEQAPG